MSKPSPHLWTAEDEDQLRWMVTAGKNVEMIAAQLNRKPICSARKGLQTEPFAWLFWVDETKVICLRRTPRKRSESRDRLRAVFLFVLQARLSNLHHIPGVGPMLATALVASVADPRAFRSGRNFSAWIGLVPKQHSSGGRDRLGSISKQGDRYLRSLFVAGALAVIRYAKVHA